MKPRGFAIPSAIFLLVILALLGAYMVSFSSTQHMASAQDVQGSRAYRAARLGLEWAAAKLCGAAAGCATPMTDCGGVSSTFVQDGFSIDVVCEVNDYQEAGPGGNVARHVFWITATATAGGAVGSMSYVERRINAFIEFPS